MGYYPNQFGGVDAIDIMIAVGFACVVVGVAWRYDLSLALIVCGLGVMSFGGLALWRKR